MSVPKRRPPRPPSFSRSLSPRRQWAAAKPSQVMNPNKSMKTMSATQLISCMAPPGLSIIVAARLLSLRGFGDPINDGRHGGADENQSQLKPVEERHADPGGLGGVVERHPQRHYELCQQQQVPPAPAMIRLRALHHTSPRVALFLSFGAAIIQSSGKIV